jgi:peptidoglycan/xylan/chitin deacetylase (PgdA/CDA1 family)
MVWRIFAAVALLLVCLSPVAGDSLPIRTVGADPEVGDSDLRAGVDSAGSPGSAPGRYVVGIPGVVADKGPAPVALPLIMKITLTFDDCGNPPVQVVRILDVLAAYDVKAIFFTTGVCVERYPDVFDQVMAQDHLIGNHTYSHRNLTRLSLEDARSEIANGPPQARGGYWRPPYAAHNPQIDAIAAELGYTLMLWTIDSYDWRGASAAEITNTVLSHARPGAVVLMHVHGAHTPEALPSVIEGLRRMGYYVGY